MGVLPSALLLNYTAPILRDLYLYMYRYTCTCTLHIIIIVIIKNPGCTILMLLTSYRFDDRIQARSDMIAWIENQRPSNTRTSYNL